MLFRVLIICLSVLSVSVSAATLKIATLSPEGSAWMQKFRKAAADIKSQTDGRVKIKFYPGGVMGDDEAVLKKIKIRQLHGGAMTGGSLARYYTDSQVYSLPLKFDSLGQVSQVREAIDAEILQGYEDGGFVSFGLAGGGFAYIMSQKPIAHPEDLRGTKSWAPNADPATVVAFDTFSISPIPLGIGDVLAGLQTGLIDTVATSPVAAITLQWHTQIKHVTKVPLIYLYAVMAVQKKAFDKLKTEDQLIVRTVFSQAFVELDKESEKDNEKALAALAGQGINIITPDAEQLAAWKALGNKAAQAMIAQGAVSQPMVNKLESLLADAE
ncbi:TRAP transporter substrate-binding protein [Planctobacterium marinum]|uniref:TRAP transporter substrate-binding protein n=1 Tax=Planctobacterium marinum TaxID=1631968 RepID=UPI001E2DCE8C|nr:TRAP transporter substrate-binding protein DctP [Planctobacterium marinum]MCC2605587.1 TRAP transporter substrate-binding protein DctP [Planctobacterium marinum]